jgi:hypothetical protein
MPEELMILIVLVAAFAVTIAAWITVRRRKRRFSFRPIAAYEQLADVAGRAIESDRPYHFSFGRSELGQESTITALASAEIAYHMTLRSAIGERVPVMTASDPLALTLVQDTLRRAYTYNLDVLPLSAARWFPPGPEGLAFAVALSALVGQEDISSNVAFGHFGAELSYVVEASVRRDLTTLAASDRLDGVAVAFVTADEPLIGEEMFAGGAYLSQEPLQRGAVLAQDILRWLVIGGILAGVVITTLGIGS